MSQEPINSSTPKNFSVWNQETRSLNNKNLYFRITFLILSVLVIFTGCIGTYYFYSQLGNWTFSILGNSLALGIPLACLGIYKKMHMSSSAKQKLLNEYIETCKHFLEADDLNGLGNVLDNAVDLPIAPAIFLRKFLSSTKETHPFIWRKCGVAIISGNLEFLRQTLSKKQDTSFWETEYNNYNLLELAALMVNNTASRHQTDPHTDYGHKQQREILVFLHQSHAAYLETLDPGKKTQLQAHALLRGAELCLKHVSLPGLQLNGSEDTNIQESFARITKAYVPLCPHMLFVTQESLEKIDPFYNANQRMYAEWSYITALAAQELLAKKSMDSLIEFGGLSRYWLARVCRSENAERYGQHRLKKNGESINICTPINERYHPWYEITYTSWVESNKKYLIYAVDIDRNTEEGTSFGFFNFVRDGKPDGPHFSWQHGLKFKALHRIAENWLQKILDSSKNNIEQFYSDLGAFYHVLCQYTPFERGSATFSNIMIAALLMNYQNQHPEIPFPEAINLLDCYALSMQRDEFVNSVFIPWCKCEIKEEKLQNLLKKKE